ncbi:hypothetical protein KC19_7G191800 [Ceratodon purpureus]|uniref:Uncharacterized protein n=1 Tax=Ceratodon purpureus TaxID=3225 RepID=A0A8T0H8A8_CERPU|nr:hypothetical protein KC19_7G191800 [Ceratodon purpureus]
MNAEKTSLTLQQTPALGSWAGSCKTGSWEATPRSAPFGHSKLFLRFTLLWFSIYPRF